MTGPRRNAGSAGVRPHGSARGGPARGRASVRPPADPAPAADADAAEDAAEAPASVSGPSRRLTGRATVLLLVLVMLAVAYAWPVKEYFRQRGELARLRVDAATTQARVDALQAEKDRWADPAFVEAQARDRLHFVMPGETAYVVLLPGHPLAPPTLPKPTPVQPDAWYDQLWASVQAADRPARH